MSWRGWSCSPCYSITVAGYLELPSVGNDGHFCPNAATQAPPCEVPVKSMIPEDEPHHPPYPCFLAMRKYGQSPLPGTDDTARAWAWRGCRQVSCFYQCCETRRQLPCVERLATRAGFRNLEKRAMAWMGTLRSVPLCCLTERRCTR